MMNTKNCYDLTTVCLLKTFIKGGTKKIYRSNVILAQLKSNMKKDEYLYAHRLLRYFQYPAKHVCTSVDQHDGRHNAHSLLLFVLEGWIWPWCIGVTFTTCLLHDRLSPLLSPTGCHYTINFLLLVSLFIIQVNPCQQSIEIFDFLY